jgi:hypothetical protein
MTGRGGSGGGDGGTPTPCRAILFETRLDSVQPKSGKSLKVGDVLTVSAKGPAGPITASHPKHGLVGTITQQVPNLLRCLQLGHEFSATVIEADVPLVRVRVSAR